MFVSSLLASACSQLPLQGPAYRDVDSYAAAVLPTERHVVAVDYALVDMGPVAIEALTHVVPTSFYRSFGSARGGVPDILVGVGDVLQVSIFESAAGGLFIPAEAGVRPGNFVTLPSQSVSRAGTITVPYAGAVPAAHKTIPSIERDIEAKLAKRAIEPQVVITFVEQNAASATVVGETGSAKLKLNASGDRVLDLISRAGGTRYPGYEMFVTLQRRGSKVKVYFPVLVNNPGENIYVAPGDTIYVSRQPQKFVAVGALGTLNLTTGLTTLFPFEQERLSLNEALAKAGGLQDGRANPAQVFVYRLEHRALLANLGVELGNFPPNQIFIPTIYRANFRDPSSFFYAERFAMRDKDIIYVANADAIEVAKFAAYVRTITGTISGVAVDAATTTEILAGAKVLGTR